MKKELEHALHLCVSGQFGKAKKIYLELVEKKFQHFEIFANLALIYLKENNLSEAEHNATKAIRLKKDPNQLDILVSIKRRQGKSKEAMKINELHDHSNNSYIINKVNILRELGMFKESKEISINLINKGGGSENLLINLGLIANLEKDFVTAKKYFEEVIKKNEASIEAQYNLSITFYNLKKYHDSIHILKNIKNTQYLHYQINKLLALNYQKIEKYANAKEIWELLKKDFNFIEIYLALGKIAVEQGNLIDAINEYQAAIKIDPSNWIGNFRLGEIYLKLSQWEKGFDLIRWAIKEQDHFIDDLTINKIDSSKLIIYADQGIGDEIFYIRLLNKINTKSYKSIKVIADKRMISMYKKNFPDFNFMQKLETEHYHNDELEINLSTLGRIFIKSDADVEMINHQFIIDENKLNDFDELIKLKTKNKIVGISWKSNNNAIGEKKSIKLRTLFTKTKNLKNLIYVNLQYGDVSDEIKEVEKEFNINIITLSFDLYNDFDNLFYLIKLCDFIITTSNINAHIAGILNKKTFVLLPINSSRLWYWGLNNQLKTKWYPSLCLINQDKDGDWNSCVEKLYYQINKCISDNK